MISQVTIPATDGFKLSGTLFTSAAPEAKDPPVVIINSATAVKQGYYKRFAQHLAREGMAVLTYDYRGIGGSRPESLRGFRAHMHEWGTLDFAGVTEWVSSQMPDSPIVMVGHSIGGTLFGLSHNNERVRGALMVGAQMGDWRLWPAPSRYRMAFYFYGAIPAVAHALGYVPGSLGIDQDLPRDVALEWARWGRTQGHLVGGNDTWRRAGFARVSARMLAYSFGDDGFAPRRAVDRLVNLFDGASVEREHLEPRDVWQKSIGHFGYFRDTFERTLWRRASRWLTEAAYGISPVARAS